MGLLIVATLISGSALASEARAQASFDCRRASHPTEIAICNDPDLASLDRQMDETFRSVLSSYTDRESLKSDQRAWLSDVRLCDADAGCIQKTYEDRLRDLVRVEDEALRQKPDIPAEPASLSGNAPPTATNTPPAPKAEYRQTPATPHPPEGANPKGSIIVGGLILGLIVAALVVVGGTKALADHTANRFGWPMILNWWNVLHLISIFAFLGAFSLGALMAGIVIAGGLWLLVLIVNIRKTNVLVGLTMTVLQPFIVFIMWAIYGIMKAKAEGRRI